MRIYLIGSLRNPRVPQIGTQLRAIGHDVFDDWFAGGPEADDKWKEYEQQRGRTYLQALQGEAARHIFEFDKEHLQLADAAVLVAPAGKSAHLELGWMLGKGRLGYVLLDNPDRWDVMYQFATSVHDSLDSLVNALDTAEKRL